MPDVPKCSIACWDNETTTYYLNTMPEAARFRSCKKVEVPVLNKQLDHLNKSNESLENVLNQGFKVDLLNFSACSMCQKSGGACGSSDDAEFACRLRHPNLVTLYGCTARNSRGLLLVYEFVPNGTVSDHLSGELKGSKTLSWDTRMKIATEIACALSYLHASDIIHRDVKTKNILLDNNFSVKVADFGLSRLFPCDVTHVSTVPQGSPGYLDPEYSKCYQLTSKSDVYSFGVVLVELISSLPWMRCWRRWCRLEAQITRHWRQKIRARV